MSTAGAACVTIPSSTFCPGWTDFLISPSLSVFQQLGNSYTITDARSFDEVLEEVVVTFQKNLGELSECTGDMDLEFVRTVWCGDVISKSFDECNSDESDDRRPMEVCRTVCERYKVSAGVGLLDPEKCPDQPLADSFFQQFNETTPCTTFPTTSCISEDMEAATCGWLTLDTVCDRCDEVQSAEVCQSDNIERVVVTKVDVEDDSVSWQVIASVVGVLMTVVIVAGIAVAMYIRHRKRRSVTASASGSGSTTDSMDSGVPKDLRPKRSSLVVKRDSVGVGRSTKVESMSSKPTSPSAVARSAAAALSTANLLPPSYPAPSTTSGTSRPPSIRSSSHIPSTLSSFHISPTPYTTIHPYTAAQDDETSLLPSDPVTVFTLFDDGWAFGRNERTGVEGALPQACIRPLGPE